MENFMFPQLFEELSLTRLEERRVEFAHGYVTYMCTFSFVGSPQNQTHFIPRPAEILLSTFIRTKTRNENLLETNINGPKQEKKNQPNEYTPHFNVLPSLCRKEKKQKEMA